MSNLSTLPKGDSAWLLRKAIERIIDQVSVLETNIGVSTSGNSANTQIIFNDDGTLRGDAGLVYNKTTDALTVAGLVTAGSATITGAATVTGAANLNGAVNLSTSGTPTVTLGATATYGVLVGSGTNAASIYINGATRPGNSAMLQFGAAEHQFLNSSLSTVWATLNSTGLNIANGNVILGTSGKGIDFSATSGTGTSELLNDYEEGTFSPTVEGSTSAGTVTYIVRNGVYTKVGRVVQFQLHAAWNTGTGTGALRLSGLPFTSNGTYISVPNVYPIDITLAAGYYATASVQPGTSIINIYQLPVGGGSDGSVVYDPAGQLIITGTYTV